MEEIRLPTYGHSAKMLRTHPDRIESRGGDRESPVATSHKRKEHVENAETIDTSEYEEEKNEEGGSERSGP